MIDAACGGLWAWGRTQTHYREGWVDQLRLLRLLDGKRVSDEERRVAGINLRKESDKRRDLARVAAARAEREDDIDRIRGEWLVAMAAAQAGQQVRGGSGSMFGRTVSPQPLMPRGILLAVTNVTNAD